MLAASFRALLLSSFAVFGYSGPRITNRASRSSGTSLLGTQAWTFAKSPRVFASLRNRRTISSSTSCSL